jgi:hypothetical protein
MNTQEVGEELRKINDQLSSMNKHLFIGNGRPSIMERVRVIEESHAHCPAREAFRSRLDRWGFLVAIGSVVVAIYAALK